MANKTTPTDIHVHAIDARGVPISESWDEEEFTDGLIDWNTIMREYLDQGCTKIRLEVSAEVISEGTNATD
jgi:hypothetical protein